MENEYTEELDQLQQRLDALIAAEADQAEIVELEQEVRILRAFYERAYSVWEEGRENRNYSLYLALEGYGEWTLQNVYAFLFDKVTDLPANDHKELLGQIREVDFTTLGSVVARPARVVGGQELPSVTFPDLEGALDWARGENRLRST
ncbi:MAG: hypothetical protein ACREN8_00340 [Candidatus Dormibacteraceae bacterium]